MGLLKSLIGAAAPIVGGMFGGPVGSAIGGAIGGAISSSGQPKAQTATTQQQLDPRISGMLFGQNGQQGLLDQYKGMLDTPRSSAATGYANANADYLNQYGASDLGAVRGAAMQAMQGNAAPTAQSQNVGSGLNAYAVGNMVNAPSQNNINLTPTFQGLLGGGDTSKLMNSLDAGNALAGAQFRQNQQDLTDNLQKNVLSGIRSNSVLAGQYGGSRQGVAEGNAISDFTKQLNNSNTQFGLGATAASSSALANAYENGQNRSLAAAQGLSGQQYATAFKDADTKNAAEFMNVGNVYDLGKFNAGLQQNNQQFNANLQQQGQLATNAQNNGALLAGAGLLSGIGSQASNQVNANDAYALQRAQGVNGLLSPYLSANQSQTTSQPLSQNTGANVLGGALAGFGLYNQFAGKAAPTAVAGPYPGAAAGPGILGAFSAGGY